MQKLMLKFSLLLIGAATLGSCGITSKSSTYDYDFLHIKKQGIIQRPLMVDINVQKEKRSHTGTYKNVTVNMAKEMVIAEFLQVFQADLIVQPLFSAKTENTNTRTTVEVTVSGYPASYHNFRNYEPKDSAYLLPLKYLQLPSSPVRLFSTADYTPVKKSKSLGGVNVPRIP